MKRFIVPSLAALLLVVVTAGAAAEGREGSVGSSDPPPQGAVPNPATVEPRTTTVGETPPAAADPKIEARAKAIRERASRMPAAEREEIEKQLAESEKDVDVEAVTNGDATVAERFAAEFGTTPEALLAERTQHNVGWGDVMIARTLLASAPSGTTADQLYALHAEGLGWGSIAHGLGLRAGSFAAAVKTESLVARGTMKADGKPAKIGRATRVASSGRDRARAGQSKTKATPSTPNSQAPANTPATPTSPTITQ